MANQCHGKPSTTFRDMEQPKKRLPGLPFHINLCCQNTGTIPHKMDTKSVVISIPPFLSLFIQFQNTPKQQFLCTFHAAAILALSSNSVPLHTLNIQLWGFSWPFPSGSLKQSTIPFELMHTSLKKGLTFIFVQRVKCWRKRTLRLGFNMHARLNRALSSTP